MALTSTGTINLSGIGNLPVKTMNEVGFGNKTREPIMGSEGFLGYQEKFTEPAKVNLVIADSTSVNKQALKDFANGTATISLNTGENYTLTEAFTANEIVVNVDAGEIKLELLGKELLKQ